MQYIDLDLAIKYSYSKELLTKLIKNFVVEYKEFALKIMDNSKEEVLGKIHKIKGITLNLGAQKLYDKCLEIENNKDYDQCLKELIYVFNKSYQELLNV